MLRIARTAAALAVALALAVAAPAGHPAEAATVTDTVYIQRTLLRTDQTQAIKLGVNAAGVAETVEPAFFCGSGGRARVLGARTVGIVRECSTPPLLRYSVAFADGRTTTIAVKDEQPFLITATLNRAGTRVLAVEQFDEGLPGSQFVTMNPDGSNKHAYTIPSFNPQDLALSADDKTAYLIGQRKTAGFVVDVWAVTLATGAATRLSLTGLTPVRAEIDTTPDGQYLVVPARDATRRLAIWRWNLATHARLPITSEFATPGVPDEFAVSTRGGFLWMLNRPDGIRTSYRVTRVTISTGARVTTNQGANSRASHPVALRT